MEMNHRNNYDLDWCESKGVVQPFFFFFGEEAPDVILFHLQDKTRPKKKKKTI